MAITLPESPLDRAKRLYRPMVSVDELVGLTREPREPRRLGGDDAGAANRGADANATGTGHNHDGGGQ